MLNGKDSLKLFLAGASILFWELVLIRWLSSSIRIVAYYSNFILIASFLGLGIGAILSRHKISAQKFIFPILFISIIIGPLLGSLYSLNPDTGDESIWFGAPSGVQDELSTAGSNTPLPFWLVLLGGFLCAVVLFACFGRWLADLFKKLPPLKGYSFEVGGSIVGILLFAFLSYLQTSPLVWFSVGFILIILALELNTKDYLVAGLSIVLVFIICGSFINQSVWSPYYKIEIKQLDQIYDLKTQQTIKIPDYKTYALTVNNDYHQLAMDLNPRAKEPDFFKSWRWLYDLPYKTNSDAKNLSAGPILIVGAGTGNDVAAALRNTKDVAIDAVEIDPAIIELGKKYHPENPYANPRVNIVNDDARSFFTRADKKYAKVVFGFLDSHTLMSSFSSVRLDNFVYTKESMEQVKNLLLPGGEVYLTFATNKSWLHQRFINLLDSVFDDKTVFEIDKANLYSNGIVYKNKRALTENLANPTPTIFDQDAKIPTDNWPFLYMRSPGIPYHYQVFIFWIILLGIGSLSFLKKEDRKIRLTYFFMGAGFFLIETTNIVSLSLLYGSTWVVNVTVFTAILSLILLGNYICGLMTRARLNLLFILLLGSVVLSYLIHPATLLVIDSVWIQGILAGLIFLSPVFFASLIFGHLIKNETNLPQAYGSNLLGAAVGGSLEYFSLLLGIKPLLIITFAFYLTALIYLKLTSRN